MIFHSDNETGVSPEILEAINAVGAGSAMPYGEDERSRELDRAYSDLFETEVRVYPVVTGTAANALALSTLVPPYGGIYCFDEAHIQVDEAGAPELYSGGAKLLPLPGEQGKLTASALESIFGSQRNDVHFVRPSALSLTQATELGTVYRPGEVAALSELARRHGLGVHMDGTRFANSVAFLDCSPADLTWRSGVDVLCFGATKNGAMAAEAVVFFDPSRADGFDYRRKRGGHLLSKGRFLAAQLLAYLEEDRWLRYARHSNAMARRIADIITQLRGVELTYLVEANLVFVEMETAIRRRLEERGYRLNFWPREEDRCLVRLVAPFNCQDADLEKLRSDLEACTGNDGY